MFSTLFAAPACLSFAEEVWEYRAMAWPVHKADWQEASFQMPAVASELLEKGASKTQSTVDRACFERFFCLYRKALLSWRSWWLPSIFTLRPNMRAHIHDKAELSKISQTPKMRKNSYVEMNHLRHTRSTLSTTAGSLGNLPVSPARHSKEEEG
jgi:hypothetical protein